MTWVVSNKFLVILAVFYRYWFAFLLFWLLSAEVHYVVDLTWASLCFEHWTHIFQLEAKLGQNRIPQRPCHIDGFIEQWTYLDFLSVICQVGLLPTVFHQFVKL
jgi:hypothetical protein